MNTGKAMYIPITYEMKLIYVIGLLHEYPDITDKELINNILEFSNGKGFNCDLKPLIKDARSRIKECI